MAILLEIDKIESLKKQVELGYCDSELYEMFTKKDRFEINENIKIGLSKESALREDRFSSRIIQNREKAFLNELKHKFNIENNADYLKMLQSIQMDYQKKLRIEESSIMKLCNEICTLAELKHVKLVCGKRLSKDAVDLDKVKASIRDEKIKNPNDLFRHIEMSCVAAMDHSTNYGKSINMDFLKECRNLLHIPKVVQDVKPVQQQVPTIAKVQNRKRPLRKTRTPPVEIKKEKMARIKKPAIVDSRTPTRHSTRSRKAVNKDDD